MPDLTLYHFPGACSRITMIALEHIGCDYDDVMVNLVAGEHMKPAYQATNPRGKVPALLIDGELLSENAAILLWLNETFPEAGLMPAAADTRARARINSDLFWLSAVWHPYVRANRMPIRWTTGDTAPVRERGKLLLAPCLKQLEERLHTAPWWYGEWSILDVYFYWCYTTAAEGEFDLSPYPAILRHRAAIEALPAFARAVTRETMARAKSAAAEAVGV